MTIKHLFLPIASTMDQPTTLLTMNYPTAGQPLVQEGVATTNSSGEQTDISVMPCDFLADSFGDKKPTETVAIN